MVSVVSILLVLLLPLCHSMYNVRRGPKTFQRRFCKKLPHLTFNGGDDPIRNAREKDQVVVISLVTARNLGHLRYQLKCLNVLSLYYESVENQRVKVMALNDPRTLHLYTTMQQELSRVTFLSHMDQPHIFRRLGNIWDVIIIDPCGRITFHYFYPKNSLRFRFVSDAIHSTLYYGDKICGTCHRKRPGHLGKQIATRLPADQNVTSTPSPVKVKGESGIHQIVDEENRWSNPLEVERQRQILIPNKDRWEYPLAEIVDDRISKHMEQRTTKRPRLQPSSNDIRSNIEEEVRITTTKLPRKSWWKNEVIKTFQEVRITTTATPKKSVSEAASGVKSSDHNQVKDNEILFKEVRITTTAAPKKEIITENVTKTKTHIENTSETEIDQKTTQQNTLLKLMEGTPNKRNDVSSVLEYGISSNVKGDASGEQTDASSDPILSKMTSSIEDIWNDNKKRKQNRSKSSRKQNLQKTAKKKNASRSFVSIYPKENINEGEEHRTVFSINQRKIPVPFRKTDKDKGTNHNPKRKIGIDSDDSAYDSMSYKGGRLGSVGGAHQETDNDQQDGWVYKFVHDYILASHLGNNF